MEIHTAQSLFISFIPTYISELSLVMLSLSSRVTQLDENGKEQTVVYLTTDDALASDPDQSEPRHVVLTPPPSATQLNTSAELQATSATLQTAVSEGAGEKSASQTEVVLEVLVDKVCACGILYSS